MNFIIPGFERVAYKHTVLEQVLDIPPQQCITRDNVSISVDAVVYWRIMDLEKACYEVKNLHAAMQVGQYNRSKSVSLSQIKAYGCSLYSLRI